MKLLPKTVSNPKGFTLIELLVVIAIIAVLAVMGFAAFGGLTGSGNDARRRTDIKAVVDVYEVKRVKNSLANYGTLALAADDFSGGKLPADPSSARNYCIRTSTSAVVPNATVSATDGISSAGVCTGSNWTVVGTTALLANTAYFKVCVLLNDNTTIECQGSKQ